MDRPPAGPAKLPVFRTEWEKGETAPGAGPEELEKGGLGDILEDMNGSSPAGS